MVKDILFSKDNIYIGGYVGAVAAITFAFYVYSNSNRVELCEVNNDNGGSSIGNVSYTDVFGRNSANGIAEEHILCRVPSTDLKEGMTYNFHGGALVIEGDIPEDTKVRVNDGLVIVRGDLRDGARVDAYVPELLSTITYTETCIEHSSTSVSTGLNMGSGVKMRLCNKSKTVFEGYKYPGSEIAAVTVLGKVSAGSSISSNKGVNIREYDMDSDAAPKITFTSYALDKEVRTNFDVPEL